MTGNTRKRILITAVLAAVGLLLLCYPFIGNWFYETGQQQVVYQYQEMVPAENQKQVEEALSEARRYNEMLAGLGAVLEDPFTGVELEKPKNQIEEYVDYEELLNLRGDGIMGYLEIPSISVYLPVYHGTGAQVLEKGAGHLENTSLPVGGEGTHCVLSSHTGLGDKRLFTDLELLKEGDRFILYVLDQTLVYEIDQIIVAEPDDTSRLSIVNGKDYVTLVTCTPRGMNTHRLLVRGSRVFEEETEYRQVQPYRGSQWLKGYRYLMGAGILFLILLIVAGWLRKRRRL